MPQPLWRPQTAFRLLAKGPRRAEGACMRLPAGSPRYARLLYRRTMAPIDASRRDCGDVVPRPQLLAPIDAVLSGAWRAQLSVAVRTSAWTFMATAPVARPGLSTSKLAS